jgi:hypothetical protein
VRPTLAWRDGNATFGIDRRHVVANLERPALFAVPGVPNWIRGVVCHFERALAVVDCGQLTGLVDEPGPVERVVVATARGVSFGVAVTGPAEERLVPAVGDAEGCFDRAVDPEGTRLVSPDRLVQRISEELGT